MRIKAVPFDAPCIVINIYIEKKFIIYISILLLGQQLPWHTNLLIRFRTREPHL